MSIKNRVLKLTLFTSLVLFTVILSLNILQKAVFAASPTIAKTTSGKIYFDNFNRATVGSGYTAEGVGTGGWSINSNRARYTSSGAGGQAMLKAGAINTSGDKIYEFLFNASSFNQVTPRIGVQKLDDNNNYFFDSDFGNSSGLYKLNAGVYTQFIYSTTSTYSPNTDYRVKMRVGGNGTNQTKLWLNETLVNSVTDTSPLTTTGFATLWAADYRSGATIDYDNLAIYNSTNLTVNGTLGSWGLYKNDGTTLVGSCNTTASVDYATTTSFPVDYANGSGAQIKVFAIGNTNCSGAGAASFVGTAGNEIFGGDSYIYDESGADVVPPVRSNGQPSGSLTPGTNQATLSLTTDENSTCRYSTTANTLYSSMTNTFSTTGTTSHSTSVTGLADGTTYNYYVRCNDQAGNANNDDFLITFKVNLPGFQNQTIITGLDEPTQFAFLPDGRKIILEKKGKIWVVQNGATMVDPTPFMTISNLNFTDECGVMGIVLDPNFSSNGFFYLFYTANSPLIDRISRFTAVGNQANLSSEVVIWQDDNTTTGTNWHRGGNLVIGNDGKLYFSVGDHLSANLVQDKTSNYGKIHRINLDGTSPSDNPFYNGTGPNKDSIWALGLRNPYRFYLDPTTSEMFIGDVGESTIEEVDRGIKGGNYGWPQCEGTCSVAGMINPIYEYPHNGINSAVTSGFIYRGNQFPAAYQGNFFFGDYAQGWIKRLVFDTNGNVAQVLNFEPPDGAVGGPTGHPVQLVPGSDGALYYVDIGYSAFAGTLRKIAYFSGNQPPVASASASPTTGPAPLTVNFSSAGSTDPEGQPLTFNWDFGDASSSAQPNPSHIYPTKGNYTAKLKVSDGVNQTISNPLQIVVGTPPVATITAPTNGLTFKGGDIINYAGTATDAEDGTLPASAFSWKINFLHDDHFHPFLDLVPGTSGSFTIPVTGHDFRGNTRYEITLTVTDSDGLKDVKTVLVWPQKVNLTFNTSPANLQLNIDGITKTSPQLYDTLIGFKHNLDAINQTASGSAYTFSSWSDGGAKNHDITVPATNQTYTATFSVASGLNKTFSGKVYFDDFNRTTLGSGYTAQGSAPGSWSIVSNRVRYASSNAGAFEMLNANNLTTSGDKIYEFLFNVSSFSSVTPRFQFQKVDSSNYYYFEPHFGQVANIVKTSAGVDTTLISSSKTYSANTDYRIKMRVGAPGTNNTNVWINEALVKSGTNSSPLTNPGSALLWVSDFASGRNINFDNLAVYSSTKLTVNGNFGRWALFKNDGTTRIGACNSAATIDYATVTSFPPDYANGPAAKIKIFPTGNTTCTGNATATYSGSAGNEIFGGDIYQFTP